MHLCLTSSERIPEYIGVWFFHTSVCSCLYFSLPQLHLTELGKMCFIINLLALLGSLSLLGSTARSLDNVMNLYGRQPVVLGTLHKHTVHCSGYPWEVVPPLLQRCCSLTSGTCWMKKQSSVLIARVLPALEFMYQYCLGSQLVKIYLLPQAGSTLNLNLDPVLSSVGP